MSLSSEGNFDDLDIVSDEDLAAYREPLLGEDLRDRALTPTGLEAIPLIPVRIGVVGRLRGNVEELQRSFSEALEKLQGCNVEIVFRLNDLQVARLVYGVARELRFKTAAIVPANVELGEVFDVDRRQIVGNEWGDEIDTFLSQLCILVCLGDAVEEYDEARDRNLLVSEFEFAS